MWKIHSERSQLPWTWLRIYYYLMNRRSNSFCISLPKKKKKRKLNRKTPKPKTEMKSNLYYALRMYRLAPTNKKYWKFAEILETKTKINFAHEKEKSSSVKGIRSFSNWILIWNWWVIGRQRKPIGLSFFDCCKKEEQKKKLFHFINLPFLFRW